ncbi:MAG: DnaD domain protein, partial [Clostridiales bacterium]|nr:DnaD domain protein [Clostridiales bacterium]
MSSINLELGPVIKCTSVPNIFIDQYMPNAPHAYSLIYLYLLRNGSNEYFKLDTKKMGENFNLLESDIINAFLFWHQKQVINYSNKDGHIDIKFLDLKPFKPIGLAAEDKRDEGSQEVTAPVSLKVLEAPSAIAAISSKPNYSNEEIKFSTEKSKELRSLLNFAQNKICRPLKPQEVHAIYSFVDWLRMPVPLVEKLIEYCVVDRKKMSVQYMEAVAISWADNKIKTVEEAETLTESSSFYTKVLNTFGVYGRFANDGEIKYINSWLNEYKLSEQMIL